MCQAQSLRLCCAFFSQKAQAFYLYIQQNFYNGKTMPNLVLPTRTLYVVNKAIDLFHHRGFHLIGVDRIVKESEITKATFYNYFQSKSGLLKFALWCKRKAPRASSRNGRV